MKTFIATVFFLFALVLSPLASWAQEDTKQADKHFDDFEYALALKGYQSALEKNQPTLELVEKIAHCYRFMNQPKNAAFWYRQVIGFAGSAPVNLFYFAEASKQNGDYLTAKRHYLLFAEREPARRDEALQFAKGCDWAMAWIDRPMAFEITQEQALNSTYADFSPVFYQDGLVFSSDRLTSNDQKVYGWTGTPYLQLYYAPRLDNNWGAIKPLDNTINTEYHNATATFSESFQEVFFTRTKQVKNRVLPEEVQGANVWQKFSKNDKFINRLEIYSATLKNGKWQEPVPFAFNKGESYSMGHPALSQDGNLLYFVSDMPGGYGQTDIYFSERRPDGSWTDPKNVGPEINTPGKEVFPVINKDGKLYFSSDGHIGMGGLDIFSAVGNKNAWKQVENLYYPFNSPRDDFGLIYEKDGKNGFFSSNRDSDVGSDNIFRFAPKFIPCKLAGVTFVRITSKNGTSTSSPVEGVTLSVQATGGDTLKSFQVTSNAKGEFLFEVEANTLYTIKGSKRGYLNQTIHVAPDCRKVTDTVSMEMVLNRDTPNKAIVLENIYYDLDKYDLRAESIAELDKVVAMLQDNPTIRIELGSHTDSRQTMKYNQLLSQMRAATAVKYILSKGINPKRVIAKGYGETKLRNKCTDGATCSEEEHQLNRRTEFKILR
ncbi:OmpA family protein [Rufibacter sp. LB8]|uniref:OmpA family protein n=1 Tax=Rufibacter sp. LB8 TaxID=2777781 RepID=UPI002729E27F|nr:OmpA family protein [Rufibacter sp. LB8]